MDARKTAGVVGWLDDTIAGLDRELEQGQSSWGPFTYGNTFDRAMAFTMPLACAPAALEVLGPPIQTSLFSDNQARHVECERLKGRLTKLRSFLTEPSPQPSSKTRTRRSNRATACTHCNSTATRLYNSVRTNPKCYSVCNDCGHTWPQRNRNYTDCSAA